jgi:D-alanyl-lipoteichoic acid acyltransferase DltB (MBOAT superfamily)
MLFNSLEYLFLFLPLAVAGYWILVRWRKQQLTYLFLIAASLVFYGWHAPQNIPLLLASVGFNYLVARGIERRRGAGLATGALVALGITVNVAALAWFKYANFFVETVNLTGATAWSLDRIALPLAISFYTLQQIAFLVDTSRGEARTEGLIRYATFVLFFPRLLAGPIVRHREVMPQFASGRAFRFASANIVVGSVLFAIGLFKRTVIADSAGAFATPVYDAAKAGAEIGFADGWLAAICYTLQLYFDFSGYSDMAIGCARMFGIVIPMNFFSPLKAGSIIEYWRRWHMTLQRFILTYIYQPLVLPLARVSAAQGLGKWPNFWVAVAVPTILAFLISGLWHGAAFTFILWGLIHGVYVVVNEAWRTWRRKDRRKNPPGPWDIAGYRVLTLFAIVFANVMFRAETVGSATAIWAGMVRLKDIGSLAAWLPATPAGLLAGPIPVMVAGIALLALFPNSQQLLRRYRPVFDFADWRDAARPIIPLAWRPTLAWALGTGLILAAGLAFMLRGQTQFIYFNF